MNRENGLKNGSLLGIAQINHFNCTQKQIMMCISGPQSSIKEQQKLCLMIMRLNKDDQPVPGSKVSGGPETSTEGTNAFRIKLQKLKDALDTAHMRWDW